MTHPQAHPKKTPHLLLELRFLYGGWILLVTQCSFFENPRNPDPKSGFRIDHSTIPTLLRLQRIRVCAGQLLAQAAAGLLRGQKVAGW